MVRQPCDLCTDSSCVEGGAELQCENVCARPGFNCKEPDPKVILVGG